MLEFCRKCGHQDVDHEYCEPRCECTECPWDRWERFLCALPLYVRTYFRFGPFRRLGLDTEEALSKKTADELLLIKYVKRGTLAHIAFHASRTGVRLHPTVEAFVKPSVVLVCAECKGVNIQAMDWVDANGDKVVGGNDDPAWSEKWCEDSNTNFETIEASPELLKKIEERLK